MDTSDISAYFLAIATPSFIKRHTPEQARIILDERIIRYIREKAEKEKIINLAEIEIDDVIGFFTYLNERVENKSFLTSYFNLFIDMVRKWQGTAVIPKELTVVRENSEQRPEIIIEKTDNIWISITKSRLVHSELEIFEESYKATMDVLEFQTRKTRKSSYNPNINIGRQYN